MAVSATVIHAPPRLALNRAELALSLGFCVNTIDVLVKDGRIPPPRRFNKRKIWLVHEVTAALTEWPSDGQPQANKQEGDVENSEWSTSA